MHRAISRRHALPETCLNILPSLNCFARRRGPGCGRGVSFRAGVLSRVGGEESTPALFKNETRNMNTTEELIKDCSLQTTPNTIHLAKPFRFPPQPQEWKIISLRECPTSDSMQHCESPEQAAAYWRSHVESHPYFDRERECLVVLILNTRRRIKGHNLISIGTMDSILCTPLSIFRLAVVASASAIILMHNHPSGDETPSQADIKTTIDLVRAGQILKIDVVDHIVMGNPRFASLRALGHFQPF